MGRKGARVNSISPGIIVTPLALDEFNGLVEISTNMFANAPAGRPGTAWMKWQTWRAFSDERQKARLLPADFLIDGSNCLLLLRHPLSRKNRAIAKS